MPICGEFATFTASVKGSKRQLQALFMNDQESLRLAELLQRTSRNADEKQELWQLQSNFRKHKIESFFREFDLGTPDLQSYGTYSMSAPSVIHAHAEVNVSENKNYKGGPLYYRPKKGERFAHYTSLSALTSILKGQSIRLYCMGHQEDPREVNFGSEHLGVSTDKIDQAKNSLFIFSLVKYSGKEALDMWRLYGHNGMGACIIFRVNTSNFNEWKDYNFTKVQYISKESAKGDMESRIQEWELKNEFRITGKEKLFARRASTIKCDLFCSEREFRLIQFQDHPNGLNSDIFQDRDGLFVTKELSRQNRLTYYTELPLGKRFEADEAAFASYCKGEIATYRSFRPKLEVERIIIGYSLGGRDKTYDIEDYVFDLVSEENFPERPKVSISSLYDYFNP